MHPGRVDVIAAGALVLLSIMERFGAEEVVVSEHDILDGIAWSVAQAASEQAWITFERVRGAPANPPGGSSSEKFEFFTRNSALESDKRGPVDPSGAPRCL
ncbi:hypothetical protein SPURM210S_02931 [Streptomyces purpurascens]